ncbi:hypothetical protein HYX14_04080 [Candidatus Woesearchaeota archaeon]|nr:hypothetical protein [Candidatus Woesearchaeota archaeon]
MRTSNVELIHITRAWIAIAVIFTFLYGNITLFNLGSFKGISWVYFATLFGVSLFTVGIGFLLHELAHKFVAQHYGCEAEFRVDNKMLLFALALAVALGSTFIAPGAVMIAGMITRRENGIISAAGPLTNYVLALVYLAGLFFLPFTIMVSGQMINLWAIGFSVNMFLGLFNMIPFLMFDGKKIFDWNKAVWTAMVAFGVVFLFFL